jgi:hypothetical protein
MIFGRGKSKTPGVKLGRYENGLDAVWAWGQFAHLLVVERENYGAGENLVRLVAREHDGERIQLDPKGYIPRGFKPWMFMTYMECAAEVARLGTLARERAQRIAEGESIEPMLVTIPELHDVIDILPEPTYRSVATQFMNGLARLLKVGREGRVHVLANVRQHTIYPAYLPVEIRAQFPGLLVLGKTSDAVTRQLGLPHPFDRPHGRLGDLEGGFWPLEVRRR